MSSNSPWKRYKTNPKTEQEGIWLDYSDFKIRVRRAGTSNPGYVASMRELAEKNAHRFKSNSITPEEDRQMMAEVWADHIIVAWEGPTVPKDPDKPTGEKITLPFLGPDDKPLPFNRKNVIFFLLDLPDLFIDIREAAAGVALFRADRLEEQEKNSSKSSNTKSQASAKTATKS